MGWKTALATALGVVAALMTPVATPAFAQPQVQSTLASDNPANWTPNVLDGQVNALVQVGNRIIAGGIFTQVQAAGDVGPIFPRTNMFAFDATTGAIDTSFAPLFDDEVTSIVASPDSASLYVGGAFSNVNGATARSVVKIDAVTGAKNTTYKGGANGRVNDIAFSNGRLIIGGQFTSVKTVARNGIASLNPTNGDVTNDIANSFVGIHNPTARGGAQKSAITKFAVNPAGTKLVAIGNFTSVDGVARDQVAMLDISTAPSTLASWYTTQYTSKCSNTFTTYMRDLDISPDGTYVVISTTGAYGGQTSGCDVISRYEMNQTGTNLQSTWRDYTGGDTTYAVDITGSVVYVGGHFRWMNNAFAGDRAGAGAVAREGLAALDPANGLPLSWNPGRDRGVGVYDILTTSAGIWIGDDTERVNNERRARLAFFPLTGGKNLPGNATGTLPTDVYQLGASTDPSVLYRVNAGGPELASVDDGPNWAADSSSSPSTLHNVGGSATTYSTNVAVDATVPNAATDKPPVTVFNAIRSDPSATPDMLWSLPVTAGTPLTVRLYFANRTGSTRILNMNIDGSATARLTNFTVPTTGTMRSFDVVSDGIVNLNFTPRATGDPQVSAIEILDRNAIGGGGATAAQVRSQSFSGSGAPGPATVTAGTEAWGQARGAFDVDDVVYTGFADGTFTKRSFNGVTWGSPSTLNLLGDSTTAHSFVADLPSVTGMFYDTSTGRMYFTLANDTNLYYRYFTPESGVVGTVRYSVTTGADLTAMGPQRVAGMFLSGSTLYFADKVDKHLYKVGFANGAVTGPAALVDSTIDWRARGLFLRTGLLPNHAPVALATSVGCTDNVCTFDGSGSTDSDGQVVSYAWDFGDGTTDSGSALTHAFTAGGSYDVTLTVTDDRGGTDSDVITVNPSDPPNQAPSASFTTNCLNLTCTFDGTTSSDADGTVAAWHWDFGDTQADSLSGATVRHTYAAGATYTAHLVVTDDDAADSAVVDHDVTVTPPPVSAVQFRDKATFAGSAATQRVTVPPTVQTGDTMLLFVTSNSLAAVSSAPVGWTQVTSQQSSTDTRTILYRKVATASDAGSQVSITFAATTKADLTLLAYSGVAANAIEAVASAPETVNRATHTTPGVTVPTDGSWVVNYWADKSSATTGWTLPAGQVQRTSSAGTGAGRITSISSDIAESWPAGPSSGVTATADSASAKATMWSVVLKDTNAPNKPPVASFTTDCTNLACTVNGSDSSDPDGTVSSYMWDFGDGNTDVGITAGHTYTADGTYTVRLVVTDNEGLPSAEVTHDVTVAAPPIIDVAFRDAATVSMNSVTQRVAVPAAVRAGDAMLLFVTTNNFATVVTPPAGWTSQGQQQSNTDTQTLLFSKVATGSEAGTNVSITFAATSKGDLTLLAYSGVSADPITAVASAGENVNRASHTTPGVTVPTDRSWVVSYWADKSTATTGWTAPAGQTQRTTSIGTGSGHITSLATDSGVGLSAGPTSGLPATADGSSSKATMWSVVIQAAS